MRLDIENDFLVNYFPISQQIKKHRNDKNIKLLRDLAIKFYFIFTFEQTIMKQFNFGLQEAKRFTSK